MSTDASPKAPALPASARGLSIVCMVPTYDEVENILLLARELLALGPEVSVLVVDDDSPDGTWKLVRDAGEPRLALLHRTTDRGRGSAGRAGYARALELGADLVVEMDADFSHHPRFVPAMVARMLEPLDDGSEVGLVLGSRGVSGGTDLDRGVLRRWITLLANFYIRTTLGVRTRDCNSGFRCWRRSTLERIDVGGLREVGPAIVQETLFKTARAGIAIAEVPIEFVDRERGDSTLTIAILLRSLGIVMLLRLRAMTGRL